METARESFLEAAQRELRAFEEREMKFRQKIREERASEFVLLAKDLKLN